MKKFTYLLTAITVSFPLMSVSQIRQGKTDRPIFNIKNRSLFRYLLLCIIFVLMSANVAWGQGTISSGGTYSQNFDGIGATATASLPTGWKAEKNATVRTIGAYSSGVSATERELTYNATMSSTAANGIWNFGGTSAADRAVGGISSGSASKSVNMFLQLSNNGSTSISSFTISYTAERYRNGTNAAGSSIRLYYSTTGASGSWTEVTSGVATFAGTNANNDGSATNPMQTINISSVAFSQSLAAGSSIYLAWSYSVTSGTTTSNVQALGIDNISITAAASSCKTPTISFASSSVTKNAGDAAFTNTFTSNGTGAVTYTSSNTSAATVNSSSGQVTIVAPGTTTITANQVTDGTYCAGSANYSLTVNCIAPTQSFASSSIT